MVDLSLEGKSVELVVCDEKNAEIKKYYKYVMSEMNMKNIHIQMLIKLKNSEKIIGYICCCDYNKTDNYAYINVFLEKHKDEHVIEACSMFLNYLYTCFPIRKLYYKGNEKYIKTIKSLTKVGFELEANLKNDSFYKGKYCSLYILAMNRKKFYNKG